MDYQNLTAEKARETSVRMLGIKHDTQLLEILTSIGKVVEVNPGTMYIHHSGKLLESVEHILIRRGFTIEILAHNNEVEHKISWGLN